MSILSDGEIQARITSDGLVSGGDMSRASECSYSFVPGAAFLPGSTDPPIEFPGADGRAEVIVKPGQMVWIRTLETVSIPKDLVGFWWQTNSLSRKGLMLVNMSMIEPGYSGDLACLFVNFGRGNVPIGPSTIVAKMVFVGMVGHLLHPFSHTTSRQQYDRTLRELAIDQPSSFLEVGDLKVDLSNARVQALADIKAATAMAQTEAAKAMGEAQAEALKGFRDDIPKTVRGSFVWAAAALALLTAATLGADQLKGMFVPNFEKVARSAAEDTLRERVVISAAPNSAETSELLRRIDALNKRIEKMESKK